MGLPSITEITTKAQSAFKRFPVTLLWAICGTGYTIWVVDGPLRDDVPNQTNLIITFILGVSWFIGAQFFLEQLKNQKKWIWIKAILLILLFLFYWHLPDLGAFKEYTTYVIRFFLFLIAGHLFVLFAPFLFKWDRAAYWNYLKSAGFAIVRSGIFSGVLYLGLVLALLAIDALFDVRIDDDIYFQLFIFCLGIVNTWIYLSDFPKDIHQNIEIHFNKALEVFVKYILIPLVLLYTVILYAYGFKILLQWELPKGWVSYLVTALALLGFIVQVITNPIQKTVKSWTINQYYPWFHRLLLPLIILLFVAIFRRIVDYGITENRYFVLAIAFWIFGMTLFLLFSKKKSLIILPLSLFILAILSSFGFWGASSVSRKSQIGQFTKVFETVTHNGKVATAAQHDQLRSILDYLDDRQSVSELDAVTGIKIKELFTDDEAGGYAWFDTHKVLDSLGISLSPEEMAKNNRDGGHYYYSGNREKVHNYDIDGYQHLTLIVLNDFMNHDMEIGNNRIEYNKDQVSLSLWSKKDSTLQITIPLRKKLIDLTKLGDDLYNVDPEEMTLVSKNDSIWLKLVFEDLNFTKRNDSITLSHSRAMLFLKQESNAR